MTRQTVSNAASRPSGWRLRLRSPPILPNMFSALKIVALAARACPSLLGAPPAAASAPHLTRRRWLCGAVCGLAAAGGGNCANVCESGMTHYRTCIAQTMCAEATTACGDGDDSTREPPTRWLSAPAVRHSPTSSSRTPGDAAAAQCARAPAPATRTAKSASTTSTAHAAAAARTTSTRCSPRPSRPRPKGWAAQARRRQRRRCSSRSRRLSATSSAETFRLAEVARKPAFLAADGGRAANERPTSSKLTQQVFAPAFHPPRVVVDLVNPPLALRRSANRALPPRSYTRKWGGGGEATFRAGPWR